MTSESSDGVDISATIDGFFFGFIVAAILFGVTIVQGLVYFHENRDRWPLRTFVIVLVVLDVAETCCGTQILRHYLVKSFGNVALLGTSTNVVAVDFAITLAITFLVHLFFISRILILGGRWWLATFVFVLSVISLAFGIWMFPHHLARHPLIDFSLPWPMVQVTAFHSFSAITDIFVTIALSHTFSAARDGYASTKTLIRRLLKHTISRGMIISLTQIVHIVMYLLRPTSFLFWISLHFSLSKLYVLTTLFMLNSRRSLQRRAEEAGPASIRLTFASLASEGVIVNERAERSPESDNKRATAILSINESVIRDCI